MDPAAESLARAILHDLANTLSGVRGVLDLTQGLSPQDRLRVDSLISEGFTIMERARHLVLGSRPDQGLEGGAAWRMALEAQAEPMAHAFRCPIRVAFEGEPGRDQWPGELLRSWVLAATRQVLPYLEGPRGQGLTLRTRADATAWEILWSPLHHVPASLQPGNMEAPKDIAARWVREVGPALGVVLLPQPGGVLARIPRF